MYSLTSASFKLAYETEIGQVTLERSIGWIKSSTALNAIREKGPEKAPSALTEGISGGRFVPKWSSNLGIITLLSY
jgi:hypothetical protein